MRLADRIRRRYWRLSGKPIYGVMVLAYTPEGCLILVRQTYASGWCLPGGGRSCREEPLAAAIRELREEIGAVRWKDVRLLASFDEQLEGVAAHIDLVRIEEVEFAFRRNLEIESLESFDPAALPDDLNPWAARFIRSPEALRAGSDAEAKPDRDV